MANEKPKNGVTDPLSGLELSAAQVLAGQEGTEIDLRGDITVVSSTNPSDEIVNTALAATGNQVTETEGLHAVTTGESDGGHVVVRRIGSKVMDAEVKIPPTR